MTGAGIFPGDIAVVDRAREPVNGSIVLALLDGAFTVKRYRVRDGAVVAAGRKSRLSRHAGRRRTEPSRCGASSRAASACCDHGGPARPRRLQQFLCVVRARVSARAARRAGRRAVEQRRLRDRAQQRGQGARHRHGRAMASASRAHSRPPASSCGRATTRSTAI